MSYISMISLLDLTFFLSSPRSHVFFGHNIEFTHRQCSVRPQSVAAAIILSDLLCADATGNIAKVGNTLHLTREIWRNCLVVGQTGSSLISSLQNMGQETQNVLAQMKVSLFQ